MRVYQDFFAYKSGVYRHSQNAELYDSGYHSVRIIGWGEEPSYRGPPLKYWVSLRNGMFMITFVCRAPIKNDKIVRQQKKA